MEMDKEIYLSSLYDYYSPLLTDKQKDYFEDYYFNNLSLAEIAENNDTSRNAIHKHIKDTENKLLAYEDKLKLFKEHPYFLLKSGCSLCYNCREWCSQHKFYFHINGG